MSPVELQNGWIRNIDIGSLMEPYLYAISPGQRNNSSLIFHLKIGKKFHEVKIDGVQKNSVNMVCNSTRGECKARHR